MPGHRATYLETFGHLHTTQTPKFLGLKKHPRLWSAAGFGSDCNRKLIGARSFRKGMKHYGLNISTIFDYDSPRDFLGHGTHRSSIIAGICVQDANYFGYVGAAMGVAPMARIAMYKTRYYHDTLQAAAVDVLAGIDQAVADGVDVMSLSFGFPETIFDINPIAIGAFAALKEGIFEE
ncbi:hypothetical protein KPL71_022788 [Citrus sinensis]|uniref:Uncharacterized protein n=1 Tax=Citrus sinensis TaxID=2711 RepID=A0ACB8IEL8_CITSI|nr:hypothetical protein KPL71_022788 [Citrus sinensis]